MTRTLGIDPGRRRVGLALTDRSGTLATPVRVIDREDENLSEALKQLIDEHEVERIVVGYPEPLRTDENERTREVDQFIEQFLEPLGLPWETVSERYSTTMAETLRKIRQDPDKATDDQAAALILEQFLDQARSGGGSR